MTGNYVWRLFLQIAYICFLYESYILCIKYKRHLFSTLYWTLAITLPTFFPFRNPFIAILKSLHEKKYLFMILRKKKYIVLV